MSLFEIWYVSMAVDPLSQRATGYDVISQRRVVTRGSHNDELWAAISPSWGFGFIGPNAAAVKKMPRHKSFPNFLW